MVSRIEQAFGYLDHLRWWRFGPYASLGVIEASNVGANVLQETTAPSTILHLALGAASLVMSGYELGRAVGIGAATQDQNAAAGSVPQPPHQ